MLSDRFLFVYLGLYSQYHAPIPDTINASAMLIEETLPKDHTVTYKTDTLYIILFLEYSGAELVLKDAPSKSDGSISWFSGAAAHHVTTLVCSDDNILKENIRPMGDFMTVRMIGI